jgi:hypothetical protein
MPLKLRPTGLGSGIDKDRPDYTVFTGGWEIGRIYEAPVVTGFRKLVRNPGGMSPRRFGVREDLAVLILDPCCRLRGERRNRAWNTPPLVPRLTGLVADGSNVRPSAGSLVFQGCKFRWTQRGHPDDAQLDIG